MWSMVNVDNLDNVVNGECGQCGQCGQCELYSGKLNLSHDQRNPRLWHPN